MAHLNFSDFYTVPDIKFDIGRLRTDLNKILKKRDFATPGISNFGAISVNQVPNDDNE